MVFDHLISDKPSPTQPPKPPPAADADKPPHAIDSWERIDAIVLQWIYGTISQDLLNTILKKDTTAHDAWTALENLFNDSKATRAVYLKTKFTNTRLDNFPNMHAYCQELKVIADQLANVEAPVSEHDLVIQLVTGLNEQYEGIGMLIQNTEPLPSFANARSRVTMEEQRKYHQASHAATTAGTALHATTNKTAGHPTHAEYRSESERDRWRGRNLGRGRGRLGWGRGRGSGYNNHTTTGYGYNTPTPDYGHLNNYGPAHNYSSPSWTPNSNQTSNWPNPPCLYPTTPRPNANSGNPTAGLLGPRSNQAYTAAYTPTNIEQALYTMSLNPPDQWNMDTGATSHMTNNPGNFHSFFNNGVFHNIIVGNGTTIPVNGQGHQYLPPPYPPLKLNNVLYAPKLIKNLISVRRLTTGNWVSIEFDPFGFLVKDFKTRIPIIRCNSSGDLYPLLPP
ncbi:uncharacterized protein LOC143530200 [Bidens hawaiensis]|uniref:uncharacterized protein LOC143530200 n=1 Tax=Bidens hawaiensis TaxID=980011 RepID=UPI00404B97C1